MYGNKEEVRQTSFNTLSIESQKNDEIDISGRIVDPSCNFTCSMARFLRRHCGCAGYGKSVHPLVPGEATFSITTGCTEPFSPKFTYN